MKPTPVLLALPLIILLLIVVISNSLFVVRENEQAVITEFGMFVKAETTPGLKLKKPFLQEVVYYDKRLLDHDIKPESIVTNDKRTLVVDNFAKWRITNPEQFYKRTRTLAVAKDRLRDIIFSELRLDFGEKNLNEIISEERSNIMNRVTQRSNKKVEELNMGIEIVDIRIMRADFPLENQKAVFERMSAERHRIARQFRSEGDEEAKKIIAETDKEKAIILANAYNKNQTLKGEGDAMVIKVTSRAFGKDPDFYEFIKSMEAYKKSIPTDNGALIISSDTPFMKYFK